ncbi:MAG: hypothetical protein IT287_09320 [Bdellovibrionaceae bacterium]|nr:hypothetical protein [Pseudobdellovibrionaceae bacterium]
MLESQLRFYPKAKIIFTLGVVVTLAHVVFWGSSPYLLLNAVIVGSSVLTGLVVFYAFYKGVNVAKYALYFLSLISILSLAGVLQVSLAQKLVLISTAVLCLGTLAVLRLYREESLEYFKTSGLGFGWKVAYVIVLALVIAATATAFAFQARMRSDSHQMAGEMESTLLTEGTVNPAVLNACKEKYITQDLNEDQLHKFCTCISLNLENIMKNADPDGANISGIMARSMALGDLCMKKVTGK